MERRLAREQRAQRAALEAHQDRAKAIHEKAKPRIVRDKGAGVVSNIKMEGFSVSNGGKELIQDGTLMLAFGRRYGLIGRNGTGKTTLLRAMAEHNIKGLPSYCQVVHVEQEAAGDDTTVLQSVLECDVERSELLKEEQELMQQLEGTGGDSKSAGSDASTRLSKIYEKLNEIDAYNAEAKAAGILSGLSFTPDMQNKKTSSLSGGWRMRVALAQALFVEPDLLLLDEPTNHLDLHAVLWLEDCLAKWPKTLLIVSHAREFLNAVCTDIVHLHSSKLTTYKGDYDTFEKTMRERHINQQKQAESQERQRKHTQAFIDKFRYNAKRASLVQSRLKALKRMAEIPTFEKDPEYQFQFPDPGAPVSPPILGFNDVSFNYPGGPTLFKKLNFGMDLESRFAIVGPNGIGKSTLLNLISGYLEPTEGSVQRNPRVRFATFSQHHVDGLDLALSPLQYMVKTFPEAQEQVHRGHLGAFGISGPLALQPMYTLSGGQKNRVALSKITWTKPHVLLLDEPSNHLDMDAVDALIEGLNMYKGAVLMVSHDQYLIESTVDELWMCEDNQVTVFHGTFQEYKNRLRKAIK